jgi:phosphopantetheinyl transferase
MHLYTFNIDNWDPSPDLIESLPQTDQLKISRIKIYNDRLLSLAGKILSRVALSKLLSVDVAELLFDTTAETGKPILLDTGLPFIPHFNISHHESWVVVAVDELPVGVDVVSVSKKTKSEFILSVVAFKHYFSQKEWIWINNGDIDRRFGTTLFN